MSWKRLTYDDMRMYLAKDELDKLETCSIDTSLSTVVNDTLDLVADAFRGAWLAKGYQIDSREHYITTSYQPFIMAYARWTLWNRFPNAGQYALTETRKDEWELAKDLLKNPYIGVEQPENGGGGGGPGDISYLSADNAIEIPWLRFPPEIGECGFPEVYWPKHGGFGGCCK